MPSLTWIATNKEEEEFLGQIATYPDRIVGLLAPAIVDARLEAAIRAQWQDNPKKKFLKDLFRDGGGPFSSFGIKTRIGFAIRLYGEDAYNDLRILAEVRNAFAHKLEPKDFQNEKIAEQANKLTLPSKYSRSPDSGRGVIEMAPNTAFFDSILAMVNHSMLSAPVDARTRFIRTVEILTVFLQSEEAFARTPELYDELLPPKPRF